MFHDAAISSHRYFGQTLHNSTVARISTHPWSCLAGMSACYRPVQKPQDCDEHYFAFGITLYFPLPTGEDHCCASAVGQPVSAVLNCAELEAFGTTYEVLDLGPLKVQRITALFTLLNQGLILCCALWWSSECRETCRGNTPLSIKNLPQNNSELHSEVVRLLASRHHLCKCLLL
ncbi:hypothetical protein EDC04DRAFT_2730310 [Pisolithus marmoratus]|nr:hypothetical protein EDC04DRAFT_2730310 [Pisolithus marmoratus]